MCHGKRGVVIFRGSADIEGQQPAVAPGGGGSHVVQQPQRRSPSVDTAAPGDERCTRQASYTELSSSYPFPGHEEGPKRSQKESV